MGVPKRYSDELYIREGAKNRGLFQEYRDICKAEGIEVSHSVRSLMRKAVDDYRANKG